MEQSLGDAQSNFGFLQAEWLTLAQRARKAEQFALIDPRISMFYARHTAQHLVDWLNEADPSLPVPYKTNLNSLTSQPEIRAVVGPVLCNKLDVIRTMGNRAVHDRQSPSPLAARGAVSELSHICHWLAHTDTLDSASHPSEGLARFVRSRVELDLTAMEDALSEFIAGSVLTAAQLDFLGVLTRQLTENSSVPIGALYESPYSELAPAGPDELFGDAPLDNDLMVG